MKRPVCSGLLFVLASLLATTARAQPSVAGTDLEKGRTLALGVCSACHVVGPDQPRRPSLEPPAPSFLSIAQRPGVTAGSLRKFLLTTHKTLATPPNMPSMLLSDDEARQAVTYILSLKSQ